MRHRTWHWSAFCVAAAGLAWLCWRGSPHDPATLISRVDVVVTLILLAALPWPVRRRFGSVGDGWVPRLVRVSGYAAVFALTVVKADAERVEYARITSRGWLAGIWVGQVIFLLVLAVYLAGLLVVTARCRPLSAAALSIGTGAGIALGLVIVALRPLAGPLHVQSAWIKGTYDASRAIAVPLVLGAVIAAGRAAARRTSRRDSRLPMHVARARQGVAAGLCVGVAAALLVCVLGIATIALVPHVAGSIQWSLPALHLQPGTVYKFEVSVSDAVAGYLSVLVFFPLIGAGLGAWGGMSAAGNPGRQGGGNGNGNGGGGGGGGGPDVPEPEAPPPGGREHRAEPAPPAADIRRLLDLPPWKARPEQVEEGPLRPRTPV
jgi:hypothetical protein